MRYKPNDRIGNYLLIRPLGEGGNGEVWEAAQNDTHIALKILTQSKPYGFERFKSEVEILKQLGGQKGILPILDYHLPTSLHRRNPSYLVTPIAEPIRNKLENEPLETVVSAMATIGTTLAELAARGIAHRDIKPENLYHFDGDWVIGDFGLVDFPGKTAITEDDRKLGPQHYIAPEMLNKPSQSDGLAADVYSFAKTLWALATGNNYPPPGQQRLEQSGYSLGEWLTNPKVLPIDRLIEQCTNIDPILRPSISHCANELQAWLQDEEVAVSGPEIAKMRSHIDNVLQPLLRLNEQRRSKLKQADELYEDIKIRFDEIWSVFEPSLKQVHKTEGLLAMRALYEYRDSVEKLGKPLWQRGYSCQVNLDPSRYPGFITGAYFIVLDNNKLYMFMYHLLHFDPEPMLNWGLETESVLDSLHQKHTLDKSIQEYTEQIPSLVEEYSWHLRKHYP